MLIGVRGNEMVREGYLLEKLKEVKEKVVPTWKRSKRDYKRSR